MSNELEKYPRRYLAEAVETQTEVKEKQIEEAEKKMAAKERVEVVAREVKNTKQQIQNIIANMQAVIKAVAAIRAQLQVAHSDDNIPSVQRDKINLESLRNKLAGLYSEIKDLKSALLIEERKATQEEYKNWSADDINAEAERRVAEILKKLKIF